MRSNFWSLVFIRTTFSYFHCEVKTTDLQAPCQWTGHGPMAGGNEGAMGLGIFTVQPWHSTRYVLKNLLFCVVEALLGRRLKCVVAWVGTVIRCGTRGTRLLACSLGSWHGNLNMKLQLQSGTTLQMGWVWRRETFQKQEMCFTKG